MAKLTLSIDDELLHGARKYALEHRTTVNQLVRDHLAGLNTQQERQQVARERWKALCEGAIDVGPITWKRQDLYDRRK